MATDTTLAKAPAREARKPMTSAEPIREARKPDRAEVTVGGRVFSRDILTSQRAFASPYDIPRDIWPAGVEYQWKRKSVAGQEDGPYLADLQRRGWQFVPADRHPGYPIEHEGLVLMEIPAQWLEEYRARERMEAQSARRNGTADFNPANGFERRAGGRGLQGGRHEAPGRVDPSLKPMLQTIDE